MQVEVVVNCGAGSVESDAGDEERRLVVEAFAPLGVEPRVAVVVGGAVPSAVRAAVDRGADVVAVAGGDGTIGSAAGIVAEAGIVLGVLPRGTFNHFAGDLGIPSDLADAARIVVEGRTAAVDLAEVNDRAFVNNSSIGLYPVMVDVREDVRSRRSWGKVRAAPVAAWRVLHRFPIRRLSIHVDGERWNVRSPFVFVGNNRYEVGLKGVGARTRMAEGVLCCYVARASSRLGFVRMALAAVVRGAAATPALESASSPEVTVDAHGHRLLVAVDGEVETIRSPLRYRVRSGALRVRVPEGALPLDHPPPGPVAGAGVEGHAPA